MLCKLSNRYPKVGQAARLVVEMLERRVQMDSTFQTITPTPFSQDWSNTGLIATNNNWNGAPGIIGYNGSNSGAATDADPETITADLVAGLSPQVSANQTDPTSAPTNGVAEFQIANPTIALKASSGATSPFLLLNLNTTGSTSVQVSYNLRDIDATANDVVSQVALQYRVGTSGAFTNVPAGYVHDASTGPGLATLVTPVSATLPVAAANQAQVQVRIISSNANGTDEWIGVDDIVVKQGNAGALAFATATPTVNESAGVATINVTRSGGASGIVSVHYAATAGSADAGDFTAVSGTLTFITGQTTASFDVPITNDGSFEPAETINLALSTPTGGATIGSPSTATLTIYDNDGTAPAVLLNEIDVNPPTGADAPYEYVEMRGPASASLGDVYFVSLDGDAGNEGIADVVMNLTGKSTGSNGLLMINSTAGGFSADAGTTVVTNAEFDVAALENNANSFVVIYSQTPITEGTDLDPENDGVLNLASGAVMSDGIGWKDGGTLGTTYGVLLNQSSGTPDAATRYPSNSTALSSTGWYDADLLSTTPSEKLYDTSNASLVIPAGAILTPGAANYAGPGNTAGAIGFSGFNYNQSEAGGFETIIVERTAGLSGLVTVNYAATAGSATAGSDFTAVSGTLVFADGETTKTFTVPISEDTNFDPDETINLSLSNPTGGALIGPHSTSTLTIADNEVLLNDIKANPPGGTDNPHEFIEVLAKPTMQLSGIYVAQVEGDPGGNIGQLLALFSLNSVTVGSTGLVMIKSPNNTDFTVPNGTVVLNSSALDQTLFSNNASSFVVIYSPTTTLAQFDDLDANDDGDLDLPTGAVLLDGIGWKQNGTTGTIYTPGLTQVTGTPDASTRFVNDRNPLSDAAWYNADLIDVGNDPTTMQYDPAKSSANLPVGGTLTPGAPNVGNRETVAPTLDSSTFAYDATAQSVTLDFSERVFNAFSTSDFTLVNRTAGNTVVPSNNFDITEGPNDTIVLKFKNYPASALPDGRYRLNVIHPGIKDAAGNRLGADMVFNFFALSADANHDATVNALDFNALAANYGLANRTFSQGDYNYDGSVNTLDFMALSMRFGTTLATVAPGPVALGTVLTTNSIFSKDSVGDNDPLTVLN